MKLKLIMAGLMLIGFSSVSSAQEGLLGSLAGKLGSKKEKKMDMTPVDPNDTKKCLPAASMKDEKLEAAIMTAFKKNGWRETPGEVRIVGNWYIVRNEYSGIITHRSIDVVISSTLKNKCQYQEFVFSQEHDGVAFMDEVYMNGIGSPHSIPCGCMFPPTENATPGTPATQSN